MLNKTKVTLFRKNTQLAALYFLASSLKHNTILSHRYNPAHTPPSTDTDGLLARKCPSIAGTASFRLRKISHTFHLPFKSFFYLYSLLEKSAFSPPHPSVEKKKKTIYIMTHKWNYRLITPEQTEASQQLARELGISPILGNLLVERGITNAAAPANFSAPSCRTCTTRFL